MVGRDRPRSDHVDDWFAEPEPPMPRKGPSSGPVCGEFEALAAEKQAPSVDDWLSSGETVRTRRPRLARADVSTSRAAVAAGVLALVLLLVGLAAAGVFSGGSRPRALITSTLPRTTTAPSTPKAVPARVPTTTLKVGDHGQQVRVLQRALASLGYPPGSIDGQYGAATTRAVANFQQANNLTADGVLGPATLAALTHTLRDSG